jgi:ribulose-5-phosphate 4-epimerase/fuculose-1-phosphate aldolase
MAKMGTGSRVAFDERIATLLLTYARMVVSRGYVHNTLGNVAIRVPHPGFADGVVYTKPAGISLEELTRRDVVVTDVPTGTLLYGRAMTSVGHQLNREIFRLRPDVNGVIHVHHDETIALFASGALKELRVLSLEFPPVMAKPPHRLPSHVDVERDVGPLKEFIADTNAILMENHGVTTLGGSVAQAYHRLNTLAAEVRRTIIAEQLAALRGTEVQYLDQASVDWLYQSAARIIHPSRAPIVADPSGSLRTSPGSRMRRRDRRITSITPSAS